MLRGKTAYNCAFGQVQFYTPLLEASIFHQVGQKGPHAVLSTESPFALQAMGSSKLCLLNTFSFYYI